MRIRVVINLYKPLERGRTLFISGNPCLVSFRYENLLVLCFNCGRILHDSGGCLALPPKKASHRAEVQAWGPWMRADDLTKAPDFQEGVGKTSNCSGTGEKSSDGYPKGSQIQEKENSSQFRKSAQRVAENPELSDASSIQAKTVTNPAGKEINSGFFGKERFFQKGLYSKARFWGSKERKTGSTRGEG